jgi:hypothetical protein
VIDCQSKESRWSTICCNYIPITRNELIEVFVVRDVIAHNHLWEIDFSWTEESEMTLLEAEKESTAGDDKYKKVVDEQRRTKTLSLNVVPTKVDRTDVFKVFDIVWETLVFLEKKNRNQCYVSNIVVRFNAQTRLFGEVRDELEMSSNNRLETAPSHRAREELK